MTAVDTLQPRDYPGMKPFFIDAETHREYLAALRKTPGVQIVTREKDTAEAFKVFVNTKTGEKVKFCLYRGLCKAGNGKGMWIVRCPENLFTRVSIS